MAYGLGGAHGETTMTPPESGSNVMLNSIGVGGGSLEHRIIGCNAGSLLRVEVKGAGNHTLILGNGEVGHQKLQDFNCHN